MQDLPGCFLLICFYVGLITIAYTLIKLVSRFVLPPLNLYLRYGGGWAIVTGGSDGIGQGFCEELARLGFNICVISRTKQKIDNVCAEAKKINRKIQTKAIAVDFSNSFEQGFYENIMKQLKDLDISMLINNVGALSEIGLLCQSKPTDIFKQSTLNLMPVAMMTRLLIPQMLARQKKSAVVTLSSYSTLVRLSHSANYCASKLFDDRFSRSLQCQYSNKIDFLSLKPLFVTTQMTRNITSLIHVNRNQCARGALKALGRYSHYAGSWWHELQSFATELIPQPVRDRVMSLSWKQIANKYKIIDSQKKKLS